MCFFDRFCLLFLSLFLLVNLFLLVDSFSLIPFFLFSLASLLLLSLAFDFHSSLLNFFLTQEVLTSLHLEVLDSRLLLRRERSVLFLFDGCFFLLFHLDLLELGQESIPVLVFEGGVLHQFSLNH